MDLSWGFIFLKSFVYYGVAEGMCATVHSRRPESNSQFSPSIYSIQLQEGDPGCQT